MFNNNDNNGITAAPGGGGVGEGQFNDFITIPYPTAKPAYTSGVYLGLTITFTVIYAFIFAGVYLQLVLVLYYRHKRFSYQTGFLYLCLIWSLLRIVLFSFYFHNAIDANLLQYPFYFLLYCFPSVLQFCTLCLLVLFFGQVYFKVARRFTLKKNNLILRIVVSIAIFIFLASSIASSYILRELCFLRKVIKNCNSYQITVIRVCITDSLFVIFGVLLGIYLFRLARMPTFNGTSRSQAVIVTIFTSFLFITRTLYNLLAISYDKGKLPDFGFDWINVSDQADLVDLTEAKKYITFTMVLLIWEIIPTCVVVIIFRIKKGEVKISSHNSDIIPRVVGKSVFTDTHQSAINYSYDQDSIIPATGTAATNTVDERTSLLYKSIDSASSYYDSYAAATRGDADSPPLNFVNENYNFN